MNRNTLTIGAALLAVVVIGFGVAVYWERGSDDEAAIMGPGRASEARSIIADIEQRTGTNAVPAAQPALIRETAPAEGQPAGGGAIAETPAPAAAAPTGADAELDAAFERARELQAAGQLDDAQVLLFFGARRGHARSAVAYAEINDPNHHSAAPSLLAEPDGYQAYRWYTAALEGGVADAAPRLDALREWAETEAAAGNADAEQLLLQWE
ncbi:MAG: hypothetical protein R3305_02675 [Gammaproteobacteria bacterium]|nr:hypothetical protein [Gammaproteobacteria bacterium]